MRANTSPTNQWHNKLSFLRPLSQWRLPSGHFLPVIFSPSSFSPASPSLLFLPSVFPPSSFSPASSLPPLSPRHLPSPLFLPGVFSPPLSLRRLYSVFFLHVYSSASSSPVIFLPDVFSPYSFFQSSFSVLFLPVIFLCPLSSRRLPAACRFILFPVFCRHSSVSMSDAASSEDGRDRPVRKQTSRKSRGDGTWYTGKSTQVLTRITVEWCRHVLYKHILHQIRTIYSIPVITLIWVCNCWNIH